ncbi:hypothetical protein DFH27DRAFT_528344 [Peziza echinospora]|nr:hypothetical protein DFH27DRAFT_528344 [Peziza echinospora]
MSLPRLAKSLAIVSLSLKSAMKTALAVMVYAVGASIEDFIRKDETDSMVMPVAQQQVTVHEDKDNVVIEVIEVVEEEKFEEAQEIILSESECEADNGMEMTDGNTSVFYENLSELLAEADRLAEEIEDEDEVETEDYMPEAVAEEREESNANLESKTEIVPLWQVNPMLARRIYRDSFGSPIFRGTPPQAAEKGDLRWIREEAAEEREEPNVNIESETEIVPLWQVNPLLARRIYRDSFGSPIFRGTPPQAADKGDLRRLRG